MSDRNVIIEQQKTFSQCCLWRMQREYFDSQGVNAWLNQVPFYITSNPFIANAYAQIVIQFIRGYLEKNPQSAQHTFYILELGTGTGRFSYYVIKTLIELLEQFNLQHISICYVMSDFTKNNIKYYEEHPALRSYIEKGLIDFAIYDLETERPITLLKKNIRLNQETLQNPLICFANYIFDTVSHDSFSVHDGRLYELLLNLATPEQNIQNNRPILMDKISVDYQLKEIKKNYYGDKNLDDILKLYQNSFTQTSFLFPIGSIRAINFLRKISNNKLFIISSDKGYLTLDSLKSLGHPTISFHGSFSMMVNFHALGEYFKNSGGDCFLQTPRKGIRTCVFVSDLDLNSMPELKATLYKYIEEVSPADYFTLHRRVSDSLAEYTLEAIAAHLNFSHWDPHIYMKLSNRIISLVETGERETIQFLAKNMTKIADNFYYLPKADCVLFEIGIFYHAIKDYQQALHYYEKSLPLIGEQFSLIYNLALCQQQLGMTNEALINFEKALEINPESKEASEWISYIGKS